MEIKNQIAIITGGGSGMGATTAKALAKAGAKVAILDVANSAEKIANEINGLAFHCDVTNEANVASVLQEIKNKWGSVRICIQCAGIATASRMVKREGPMPLEEFQRVININLVGTFNVMRLVAAMMTQAEPLQTDNSRGVIINTASVAAYEGQIGQIAYSASKGGVVSLTLPAARELAQFGIRVVTIAPGLIDTPLFASLPEAARASLASSVTYPKRLGEPEEFSKLALHIIENQYLNGCVIRLDGALRMGEK